MKPIEITEATFEEQVFEHQGLTIVDVWAPWCGPCKMIGPILDEIGEERQDVKIVKLNADDSPTFLEKLSIRGIPTLLFFKGLVLADRIIGLSNKADINATIDEHLKPIE